MKRNVSILSIALASALVSAALAGPARAEEKAASGASFSASSGSSAETFVVPEDMKLVRRLTVGGATYERYQQVHGSDHAEVLNGQITIYRDASGVITTVTGVRYANIVPTNSVLIQPSIARSVVQRERGKDTKRLVDLVLDPNSGRYSYRVESRSPSSRWFYFIDATTGKVVKRVDGLQENHGTGVKGDSKSMTGLTRYHGSSGHGASGAHYDLFSTDYRQQTYDFRNATYDEENRSNNQYWYLTDSDNHWTYVNRVSPGQPAAVDAQYYANATDDYLWYRRGFNWTACYPAMTLAVHVNQDLENAAWIGDRMIFGDGDGDGDGSGSREWSAGLDIVAHELAHGVTECTSHLEYENESGALNESFSDIVGASAEFYINEPTSSNCVMDADARQTVCPDWWIGEDIWLDFSDTRVGFRNMADPAEDEQPDHYSERLIVPNDEDNDWGGVHTNSGIPNHAFYLLVNGGRNAGCEDHGWFGHSHTQDCNVVVNGIGRAAAEWIFWRGFTSLTRYATMCQARRATEAQAAAGYGWASGPHLATIRAWNAVGVPTNC